jgi:large subunit ribosomal protein L15
MQLHNLKRNTPNREKKRIGRGGKRGKTSGRGHKGQKQHGGTPRPEMRDIIKRLPKLRGYGKNRARSVNSDKPDYQVVNVSSLNEHFEDGALVTAETLKSLKLVRFSGTTKPKIKILGTGLISKKLIVKGLAFSATAKEKIEKAGGSIS